MITDTTVNEEEFEDTKGVIRIRKSKKSRQHNGQKKKYKRTNKDLQNIHIKLNSVVDSKPRLNIYIVPPPSMVLST